jgi:hypothetical protein
MAQIFSLLLYDECAMIYKARFCSESAAEICAAMADDEELERLTLAYSKRFQAVLTEARHQITTGGIPHTDYWRQMGCESVNPGVAAHPH